MSISRIMHVEALLWESIFCLKKKKKEKFKLCRFSTSSYSISARCSKLAREKMEREGEIGLELPTDSCLRPFLLPLYPSLHRDDIVNFFLTQYIEVGNRYIAGFR